MSTIQMAVTMTMNHNFLISDKLVNSINRKNNKHYTYQSLKIMKTIFGYNHLKKYH